MATKLTIEEDGSISDVRVEVAVPYDATEVELPYTPQGKVDVYIDKSGTLRHKPYNG